MAEKSATEASNDFFLEFRDRRQAIDDDLSRSTTIPKDSLTQHFTSVLKQINDLEKDLTRATEYIPSYDERQFSLQLKDLSDRLESTKTTMAPKPKFSFKSRRKRADEPNSNVKHATETITTPPPTSASNNENPLLTDATVFITDKTQQIVLVTDYLQKDKERKSMDILLSNLSQCVIDLRDDSVQISAIHVKNLSQCLVYCGNTQSSILIYGFENSILYAGCHQLRIHEAHNVDMMLHVSSRPIIEDSDSIQVGCWDLQTEQKNLYDQVEDFNWLKKQASPNWKVMDSNRQQLLKSKIEKNQERNLLLAQLRDVLPKSIREKVDVYEEDKKEDFQNKRV